MIWMTRYLPLNSKVSIGQHLWYLSHSAGVIYIQCLTLKSFSPNWALVQTTIFSFKKLAFFPWDKPFCSIWFHPVGFKSLCNMTSFGVLIKMRICTEMWVFFHSFHVPIVPAGSSLNFCVVPFRSSPCGVLPQACPHS